MLQNGYNPGADCMRATCAGAEKLCITRSAKVSLLAVKISATSQVLTGSSDTLALQVALDYLAPAQVSLIQSAPDLNSLAKTIQWPVIGKMYARTSVSFGHWGSDCRPSLYGPHVVLFFTETFKCPLSSIW